VSEADDSVNVPILLYHNLSPDGEISNTNYTPELFAHHMELLNQLGCTPVTFDDLFAFVDQGVPLPERPVVIAFDDGYLSNYQYAFPVLQDYGYPATIFVIGSSIGHYQYYKDTDYPLTPHFGQPEIDEMTASGLISIQSHTYDMHQWPPFESGDAVRNTILPLDGESDEDYTAALIADVASQNETFASFGLASPQILAFPEGKFTALTDQILQSCGIRCTVTTSESRVNTLVCGLPQSLIDLGRMTVSAATTDEVFTAYVLGA
jgi:peptidoglycan/xylan/chitin deacetylase (PgdA/CDA1 family)